MVKYIPVVLNLYISALIIMDSMGIEYPNMLLIFGSTILTDILLLMISYACHCCLWHKLLIVNLMFCNLFSFLDLQFCLIDSVVIYQMILSLSNLAGIIFSFLLIFWFKKFQCYRVSPFRNSCIFRGIFNPPKGD